MQKRQHLPPKSKIPSPSCSRYSRTYKYVFGFFSKKKHFLLKHPQLNFRILHFWPKIRILHTKITVKPKYLWFWYIMTSLSGVGSKSITGQNMGKWHIPIFLDFLITNIIRLHHVIYFWIALELGFWKIVFIPDTY